jgi:crotonobetainyl-CoA:carnitine CoA-transferase CaiB-like acyl-CoA transferase
MPANDSTGIKETKFSTLSGRKQHEEELDRLIEQWTKQHTAEEVTTCLREAGIPVSVVETSEDLLNDRQLKERNSLWTMEHPVLGTFHHLGPASKLSKTPAQANRPSPCLGEHTEYVCHEILGIPDDEFVSMLADGVFE